jgi:hypothetical protein
MPLKYGEVNPLAVFGLRRVSHLPPHFEPIHFDLKASDKVILDWIWENLDGRFYYGDYYLPKDGTSNLTMQKVIAFEEKSEASYFGLMLTQINANATGLSIY